MKRLVFAHDNGYNTRLCKWRRTAMSTFLQRPVHVKSACSDEISFEHHFTFDVKTDPDKSFGRLQKALFKSSELTEIHAKLQFKLGVLDTQQLDLEVSGNLNVECQRCLHQFSLPVKQMTQYLLFANKAQMDSVLEQLNDQYESILLPGPESSQIAREGELDVLALIEDELLLSIPLYPKHQNVSDCSTDALDVEWQEETDALTEDEDKHSPFAGLDKLLKH